MSFNDSNLSVLCRYTAWKIPENVMALEASDSLIDII